MTWYEANLSLQLAAEQAKGMRERLVDEILRAREDAAFAEMTRQLNGAR